MKKAKKLFKHLFNSSQIYKKDMVIKAIIVVGSFLTIGLTLAVYSKLKVSEEVIFSNETDQARDLYFAKVREIDATARAIQGFFMAAVSVDADEFRVLSNDALARQVDIRSIAYAAWINPLDAEPFQNEMQRSGIVSYVIHDATTPSKQVSNSLNSKLLPVAYYEPLTPNTAYWLGLDLSTLSGFSNAMLVAVDSGSSIPLELPDIEKSNVFFLVKSIYAGKSFPASTEMRRDAAYGAIIVEVDKNLLMRRQGVAQELSITLTLRSASDSSHGVVLSSSANTLKPFLAFAHFNSSQVVVVNGVACEFQVQSSIGWSLSKLMYIFASLSFGAFLTILATVRATALIRRQYELELRQTEIELKVLEKTRSLAVKEELLRKLIDANPNQICLRNGVGTILVVNEAYASLHQKSAKEIVGRNYLELLKECGVSENLLELSAQEDRQINDFKETRVTSDRHLIMNGRDIWVHLTKLAISLEDDPNCMLIVSTDITQRKRSEALILDQQAKITNSAKLSALGEMAGGVAHEINNPLSIIQLKAEQLQELLNEEILDVVNSKKFIKQILETVDRAARIVKSLRTFSRNADEDPFQIAGVKAIVDETLELCKERFSTSGINLSVAPIPTELRLMCNSVQISQIILNLLNNSFDAMAGLAERWVRLDATDLGDYFEISVTDSGNGIPEKIREKVLQPFFTTKEIGKGTGLGLSVSKGIADAHMGSLTIDTHSTNTRFVLRLPKEQNDYKCD